MAWCERCKIAYEDDTINCVECGDALVDHLTEDSEAEDLQDYGPFVLLANVANTIEADILISRLRADGIPARKGYKSSGEYLNIATGFNFQGVDVYVPKKLLEAAKLDLVVDEEAEMVLEGDVKDDELDALEEGFTKKRKNLVFLMVAVLIIVPVVIILIYQIG